MPVSDPAPNPIDPFYVLTRLGYGPRPGDLAQFANQGFPRWFDEQLHAPPVDEPEVAQALSVARLRIKYGAGDPAKNQPWPAVDEMRPLTMLNQPIEALWPMLAERDKHASQERRRPLIEVMAATLIRATHARYQLREVICNFWHDHFNVDAWHSEQVAVALPAYDRNVIRPNALGNFHQMLEAVATSTAMLYYLSNHSSRAGAANENYGRELFELHTLGRDAYLNDKYDRWREVPGATDGHPAGYIDEDVYESARAFTGWTVEDGAAIDGGRKLPNTGKFAYVENWHDGYQKRVLATDFNEFQPPMADGKKVLDLVASHPATARYICRKLARRLVSQTPSPQLVAAAADVWSKNIHAPDQIAKVVRVIALSPEFAQARGEKVRRPLALVAGFARATGLDLMPTEPLINTIADAGQRLYGVPEPTGLHDDLRHFSGTNEMRQRWLLALGLAQNYWGTGVLNPEAMTPALVRNYGEVAAYWLIALTGSSDPNQIVAITAGMNIMPEQPLDPRDPNLGKRLALIAAYAAMSPAFQSC
ncbi:MAG TPA: DUF1800 domain-containing protein [Magnetospirillaceae bacterium]